MVGFVESFFIIFLHCPKTQIKQSVMSKTQEGTIPGLLFVLDVLVPWHTPILRFATGIANVGVNY